MWDAVSICIVGAVVLVAMALSSRLWGDGLYYLSKHWRAAAFAVTSLALVWLIAVKQEQFKYEVAYYYFTGTKNTGEDDARYQIRMCKDFVQDKIEGNPTAEVHKVAAGPINFAGVSNWDYCARTFGLNYWKHDISINGQDGGRLLCEAYARDTYRSGKVNAWCDTVFAPKTPREVGT